MNSRNSWRFQIWLIVSPARNSRSFWKGWLTTTEKNRKVGERDRYFLGLHEGSWSEPLGEKLGFSRWDPQPRHVTTLWVGSSWSSCLKWCGAANHGRYRTIIVSDISTCKYTILQHANLTSCAAFKYSGSLWHVPALGILMEVRSSIQDYKSFHESAGWGWLRLRLWLHELVRNWIYSSNHVTYWRVLETCTASKDTFSTFFPQIFLLKTNNSVMTSVASAGWHGFSLLALPVLRPGERQRQVATRGVDRKQGTTGEVRWKPTGFEAQVTEKDQVLPVELVDHFVILGCWFLVCFVAPKHKCRKSDSFLWFRVCHPADLDFIENHRFSPWI